MINQKGGNNMGENWREERNRKKKREGGKKEGKLW